MYKFTTPSTKKRSFPSKCPAISKYPNIPSCREDHLKEEAFSKSLPGQRNTLINIGAASPVNLKIISNSSTAVIRKEQVLAILICMLMAQHTKIIILNSTPVPPHKQVFDVESVEE